MITIKAVTTLLMMISGYTLARTMGFVEETCAHAKEGAYFGAGIGVSFYKDQLTTYNVSTLNTVRASFNSDKALASVFFGYGHTFNHSLYLAAEANSYFPHHNVEWTQRPGVNRTTFFFYEKYTINNYINLD